MCDDEGLVSAVTTPGYKPTVADHEALEQCFQRGLLRCDGVDSNTCDQVAECDTYATGVSGGVEHEKSIISYINGKVGGIMFWAVNEGARAPNGKTTGERPR